MQQLIPEAILPDVAFRRAKWHNFAAGAAFLETKESLARHGDYVKGHHCEFTLPGVWRTKVQFRESKKSADR